MRDNPQYKLRCVLRARFNALLKQGKCVKFTSSLKLLGCSVDDFKKYIEVQFQPGMSWATHGLKTWHLDHIRPCASFDLTDPEQQRKCFHFTNLRPLWASENLSKGAKFVVPV